jgi:uncharacterized protein (TIGR02246 family)
MTSAAGSVDKILMGRVFKIGGTVISDEQAIHGILHELESAWNTKDSGRFAAQFAEDANFIQIFGGQLDGRVAIEASHRHIFETIYRGTQANFVVRSIRFLRPDVAVLFSRATVRTEEGADARQLVETRPTMVVMKNDGKWQIVAFQNTKISDMPAEAQAASRLTS